MSVHFMMTLTRGAGALAISPMLQFHSVVPDDSPAFKLLLDLDGPDSLQDPHRILESTQCNILEMFRTRKAAPSDRLADGSTLLHVCTLRAYGIRDLTFPPGTSTFQFLFAGLELPLCAPGLCIFPN